MSMIRSILKGAQSRSLLQAGKFSIVPILLRSPQYSQMLLTTPTFGFAKLSKKEKDKQKLDEEKKKTKQEIGDVSIFDLNPFEEKYDELIQNLKQSIGQYKVGRLDPAIFSNMYIKIGHTSLPIQQLAEIAPKSSNTCVLNPFDQDNLQTIQKGVQMCDLGFQVTRVDKTILVTQLPNSMKQIKDKMLEKLKKTGELSKEKLNKVRTESRDSLKKYKKVIPEERYKVIEKELVTMHEKYVSQLDNTIKEKQKQLKK